MEFSAKPFKALAFLTKNLFVKENGWVQSTHLRGEKSMYRLRIRKTRVALCTAQDAYYLSFPLINELADLLPSSTILSAI